MAGQRRLFGTNGVRGVVNSDLTLEMTCDLGYAIGTYLGPGKRCAVGRDTRTTGPMLRDAVCSALLSTGVHITDLGVLPTPALQYAVKERYDFGVVVTASHNPPEFNGVKCIAPDGSELPRAEEERIESIYFSRGFMLAEWDAVGRSEKGAPAIPGYIEAILSHVDGEMVRGRGLTVVLDCGNGAASLAAPNLVERLGCRLITLNAAPLGTFPGRGSEPSASNLGALAAVVREQGADLGVAYDGDGDRAIFIDEKGRYLPGDRTLTLLGKWVTSRKRGVVVTPVSSTVALEEVVRENGSTLVYTAVGAPLVARTMIELSAIFGGEENGGLIFPEHQVCRDGAMSTAKLIELIAGEGALSSLIDDLPEYFNHKTRFGCPGDLKPVVLSRIREMARGERVDEMDGVKIWTGSGWVLIRPSGTEPIFRVFAEARSEEDAESLAVKWKDIGASIVRELT